MTGGAVVAVRAVAHTFAAEPPVPALGGVDLDVQAGEFVAIVGPSGCGKSTLLRILAGLTIPSAGEATIAGASTVGSPGRAAYQPQRDLLMPWRRVLANAALGAELAGVPRVDARARAEALLDRFGLTGFGRAWPAQLSGGMRQRTALLRTFLVPRPVLLLDEPLGALDALTRRGMQLWLQEVWTADARTVLLVTHDVEEAVFLADRVVVMSPRPGRFVAEVGVGLARPRDPGVVTTAPFVALRRDLLAALGT